MIKNVSFEKTTFNELPFKFEGPLKKFHICTIKKTGAHSRISGCVLRFLLLGLAFTKDF